MSKRMVCDLCQGPIEPDTVRGCIHLPKLLQTNGEEPHFFRLFGMNDSRIQIGGRHYEIEDLDICEQCVRMLRQMQYSHPAGR